MATNDIVILGAARTPIGKYGGSFRDLHPAELGAVAARAAIERSGLAPADIEEVLIGHGRQAGSGPNPARQVGKRAGVPDTSPAQTINKACASGLQTIVTGAQSIMVGEYDTVLAGGIESMSRMPYMIDSIDARWGHKMGNFPLVDAMYRDGFTCSVSGLIMGETAELLARQSGITREESDCFALESQKKTKGAVDGGYFSREIAPVTVTIKGKPSSSRRTNTRVDARSKGFEDAVVFGRSTASRRRSSRRVQRRASPTVVRPWSERPSGPERAEARARIIGWASAGVDPIMGIGQSLRLFARTGLTIDDFDLVEINGVRRSGGVPQGNPRVRRSLERQWGRHRAWPSDRCNRYPHHGDAAP
jgi:acetyl-CoA C-acetyltransferase